MTALPWFNFAVALALGLLIGLGLIYLPTLAHAFVWDDLTFVRALWPLRDPTAVRRFRGQRKDGT